MNRSTCSLFIYFILLSFHLNVLLKCSCCSLLIGFQFVIFILINLGTVIIYQSIYYLLRFRTCNSTSTPKLFTLSDERVQLLSWAFLRKIFSESLCNASRTCVRARVISRVVNVAAFVIQCGSCPSPLSIDHACACGGRPTDYVILRCCQ